MFRKLMPDIRAYFDAPGMARVDFSAPAGAAALLPPDSVTWRIMKNPVALFVGGIAAVILELAEPRVRSGVWDHTSFRTDPVTRMKRTGLAAMVTVYAPEAAARRMIEGVVRAHARVSGLTPDGQPYHANEQALLAWVQATASYGFIEAYRRFVHPLTDAESDLFYAEAAPGAALFGAHSVPRSAAEMNRLLEAMRPRLERSDIIFDFLEIVRTAPILPSRSAQRFLVRAAIDLTPPWTRDLLGLGAENGLNMSQAALVRALGAISDRIVLAEAPPARACRRLGLPANYLYRRAQ